MAEKGIAVDTIARAEWRNFPIDEAEKGEKLFPILNCDTERDNKKSQKSGN
jgi:hypothetical protein